ncbi:MAG TPA: hypothetical protein DCL15_19725 [Chloroflexi bacterium]|nr:hypothetical protein [Chloroflexota bacterium]HHW86163.1 hypothetical protein [Chloroflexota bacterium]
MPLTDPAAGHRERLRQRFAANETALSNAELLELLLTYAIPRRDVAPLARRLLAHYGNLTTVLAADTADLLTIDGMGEQATLLLRLVGTLAGAPSQPHPIQFPLMDDLEIDLSSANTTEDDDRGEYNVAAAHLEVVDQEKIDGEDEKGVLRAFVNDEVIHAQTLLPQAHRFQTLAEFHSHLCANLPYNAATTRVRRANYLIKRFFPDGVLAVPLVEFLRCTQSTSARDSAIFYELLRSEPLLRMVAEELVWPALADGSVTRETMRAFLLQHLPALSPSSLKNSLRSILTAYSALGVGEVRDNVLLVHTHPGDLDGFVYAFCAEFPTPGVYRFEDMEQGLLHKGLLWDRAWLRRQLYHLERLGLLAKVSEIDTLRQFTVRYSRAGTLSAYFALDSQMIAMLREEPTASNLYVADSPQQDEQHP